MQYITNEFIQQGPVDQYLRKCASFMHIAEAFATRSHDPSSKVGAIILGPAYDVRASGWNGAPRNCKADTDHRYDNREEKLWWVTHAEANAIANAARVGTSVEGCTLVCTHMTCMTCAKLIAQSGIIHVICIEPTVDFGLRWHDDIKHTKELFTELGLTLILI